jgi:peptidyl-prolyl cis-trans isomerase B (cyclophilin B)
MVRIEALRALARRDPDAVCASALRAAADVDLGVALVALDLLGNCGREPAAVAYLERTVADQADLKVPRGWHRHAHALVAFAIAAPDRVAPALRVYAQSTTWQVRLYAARAAAQALDRTTLEALAADPDDRVANVALTALRQPARPAVLATPEPVTTVTIDELRRLAAPRARITIRDVGRIEIALFTTEAPGTVVRFARLAESGYYNGTAFDRIVPNNVAEIGHHPPPEARRPVNEVGLWPHVRGAVAMVAPDGTDSRFFVNLVDNPALDHEHAVFGQVLNGADVLDQILEGDVIDSIEILP